MTAPTGIRRKLAKAERVSKSTVQRVWAQAQLKPHWLDRYMASDDPEFESKAADIIGLYLKLPEHAAVFCVDEKTAIQALDRSYRALPLSLGVQAPSAMGLSIPPWHTLPVRRPGCEDRQVTGKTAQRQHQCRLHRGFSPAWCSRPSGLRKSRSRPTTSQRTRRKRWRSSSAEPACSILFHPDLLRLN